ncbi:MAG: non-canonical purine NTP pyrophosphatase [Candidatus Peribacteraceae bacterium]|nr:non-canonical purine NTP pyrophosphatase [Candidatus Peribacteraceae bacterium]
MRLLIGTNNAGKVIEIGEVLAGLQLEIVTPKVLGIKESPPESGSTFQENAILKAKFFHDRSGLPTVADDSGIIVVALQDELGLHTRRWGAGPDASDQEWIEYFLERMKKEKNKRARFVCVLAYVDLSGNVLTFEGDCQGVITDTLEANYLKGLPISACFKPDGFDRVFSALSIEQKNSTSHRGKASKKFASFLRSASTKLR